MGKWRKVIQCNNCKKIYARGIPYVCYGCGGIIGRDSIFLGTVYPVNATKVIARRRLFKGWEVKGSAGTKTNQLMIDEIHSKSAYQKQEGQE